MGYEIDILKNTEFVSICYNNTTGKVFRFNTIKELVSRLSNFTDKKITSLFSYEEISDFIEENWMEYDNYEGEVLELNRIFDSVEKNKDE